MTGHRKAGVAGKRVASQWHREQYVDVKAALSVCHPQVPRGWLGKRVLSSDSFRLGPSAASICRCLIVLLACLLPLLSAQAVVFYSTGGTNFNTTPPTKSLTNSGWQYEGEWYGFTGTAISSNCFISAQHIGGSPGDKFVFQGVSYTTVTNYDDPQTDLKIWRVSGMFPTNAPLYTKSNEKGKTLMVFGRGLTRGEEVRLKNRLHGWETGYRDLVQRWGQNNVTTIVTNSQGDFLRAEFNYGAGRNEATLSGGDSGGGVFIKDGRLYKLAGVNYAVDGPYNTTNSGTGFEASMFDQRGFYVKDASGNWVLYPRSGRIAGAFYAFYATRISSRLSWITNILSQSSP